MNLSDVGMQKAWPGTCVRDATPYLIHTTPKLVSAPDLSNRTLTPGSKLLRYAHQTLATAENETCTVHFPRWILSAGESVL